MKQKYNNIIFLVFGLFFLCSCNEKSTEPDHIEKLTGLKRVEHEYFITDLKYNSTDNFLKKFDYEGWTQKKDEVMIFNRELEDIQAKIDEHQKTITESQNRISILKQVPCGEKYPECIFIRNAYRTSNEAKSARKQIPILERKKQKKQDESELPSLEKVEEYLQQHGLLLEKRNGLKQGINEYELEIAKNKTTVVTLRNSINKSQDQVRLFEENEASIKEFAALTKQRADLVNKKAKVKKLLIGHFSSRYDSYDDFENEVKPIFNNVIISEEGKKILV